MQTRTRNFKFFFFTYTSVPSTQNVFQNIIMTVSNTSSYITQQMMIQLVHRLQNVLQNIMSVSNRSWHITQQTMIQLVHRFQKKNLNIIMIVSNTSWYIILQTMIQLVYRFQHLVNRPSSLVEEHWYSHGLPMVTSFVRSPICSINICAHASTMQATSHSPSGFW